ncbi:hypothetical protein J5N97_013852 [Dioscorea zingiberensis]|uniref:Uncharacterized protein n=1 Tax=Dioscorea zingiberensis TaxID=325984 RepID=A0A9D5HJ85_9LILI|nr:hypothetical protein J5N97_013852 [Dioscorea zingiberensis]
MEEHPGTIDEIQALVQSRKDATLKHDLNLEDVLSEDDDINEVEDRNEGLAVEGRKASPYNDFVGLGGGGTVRILRLSPSSVPLLDSSSFNWRNRSEKELGEFVRILSLHHLWLLHSLLPVSLEATFSLS